MRRQIDLSQLVGKCNVASLATFLIVHFCILICPSWATNINSVTVTEFRSTCSTSRNTKCCKTYNIDLIYHHFLCAFYVLPKVMTDKICAETEKCDACGAVVVKTHRLCDACVQHKLNFKRDVGKKWLSLQTCVRCSHTWYPRQPQRPYTCPSCRSPMWDVPKKDVAA